VLRCHGGRESVPEDEGEWRVSTTENSRASRARTRQWRKSESKRGKKTT
jgi:hypothetical protein